LINKFDSKIILNELNQNIFVKDINSNYLYCNEKYAKLIGETTSTIIGKDDYDFFPEKIAEKYRTDDARIIKNKKSIDVEEHIVIDGKQSIIRTIKKPLYKDAKVYAILGIFWDITKEKEEETFYKKLQFGLLKAQELANIGHWELDLINNKLYWSDEVFRIFGLKPQEFGATYEAFLSYIHPDDVNLVNEHYANSIVEQRGYHVIHRIIKEDGSIGFVEERCEHDFDENGNAIRSIGTVHDITVRYEAEENLKLAYEVFAKMSDGVLITDANQRIVQINKAFSKMSGYSFEELEGEKPSILSSGWHSKEFYKSMWNELDIYGQWRGEIYDRKKSGERYLVELNIIALYNSENILTHYISITNDITKRKEQEELIHNLAYFDDLTKLPNRVLYEERVTSRIPASKRNGKKMALLFIDMDNFKNINDTLGHMMGDKFLIKVSEVLGKAIRENDTLARLGGDEFTVLLEDLESILEIVPIADRIISFFNKPLVIDNNKLYTSASIGISIYPNDGTNYHSLLKAADTAMYQVKDSGKNGYEFYAQDMNKEITERLDIENSLRHALSNNEFFLEYQPKVDTRINRVYGMEALIRWNKPVVGLIRPDKFISIAEETGDIYNIGLWVLKQALIDTKELNAAGNRLIVSVNVSSVQLDNPNFVADVCKIVEEINISKKYVELEITESNTMTNIERALEKLNELHDKGFILSMDDFGTGYSSLSYLKKLPVKTIKIDKSFVLDIDKNDEDRSIVGTIIAMANSLGKDVIAEGSETIEHINTLKKLNCHKMQGYYFSKPLRIDIFTKFIKQKINLLEV